jgi:hypothetical protein
MTRTIDLFHRCGLSVAWYLLAFAITLINIKFIYEAGFIDLKRPALPLP